MLICNQATSCFTLLCWWFVTVTLVPLHAQKTSGRQQGMKEIVLYDTTDADAVQFQCDPLDDTSPFNPRCNLNPTSCEKWICQGSASLTYCDSEFFVPGRTSDVYQLFNCTDDNVATCDSDCACSTGSFVGTGSTVRFEPDGGNCTIIDSSEGSLAPYPTESPTSAPATSAPVTSAPATSAPATKDPVTSEPSSPSEISSSNPTDSPTDLTTTDPPTTGAGATVALLLTTRCLVPIAAVTLSILWS